MRIYVSGKMSGAHLYGWPAFEEATRKLRDLGHEVISPAEQDEANGWVTVVRDEAGYPLSVETTEAFDFRAAIAADLEVIETCDAIYMLPGWEDSLGAQIERDRAFVLGLMVAYSLDEVPNVYVVPTAVAPKRTAPDIEGRDVCSQWPPAEELRDVSSAGVWRRHIQDRAVEVVDPDRSEEMAAMLLPPQFKTYSPLNVSPVGTKTGEVRVVDPETGGAKGSNHDSEESCLKEPRADHLRPATRTGRTMAEDFVTPAGSGNATGQTRNPDGGQPSRGSGSTSTGSQTRSFRRSYPNTVDDAQSVGTGNLERPSLSTTTTSPGRYEASSVPGVIGGSGTSGIEPTSSTGPLSTSGNLVVDPVTGGAKFSKLARFDLIPPDALWAVAEHFGRGASKYEDRNWEKGYRWGLSIAAAERHLALFKRGRDWDDDPVVGTFPHLAAFAWHALALLAFWLRGSGTDDRSPYVRGPAVDPVLAPEVEAPLDDMEVRRIATENGWGENIVTNDNGVKFSGLVPPKWFGPYGAP